MSQRFVEIEAMPNVHSHVFQRVMRGRAERVTTAARDDFWTWRREMFAAAEALTPDSLMAIAEAGFAEMLAAGYGVVGEFHYVHHQPGGVAYEDPNALAHAVALGAGAAGLPLVILPAAYNRDGWDGHDRPPAGGQRRFCDPDVESFLARVEELRGWAAERPWIEVGIAAHSVRAVPASWLEAIARYSDERRIVRHVHAHEQRRELAECQAEHGCSPIELLDRCGFLSPLASVIHGVHVRDDDIARLARTGTTVVSCPTTEGNLGDGYLPAMRYADAGVRLAIGSDSQVRIDPFEEARELESGSRRERELRAGLLAHTGDLWGELCRNGRHSLGVGAVPGVRIDREHTDLRGVETIDLRSAIVTSASAAVVAR